MQTPTTNTIDLSAGLVPAPQQPSQGGVDLSAGLIPTPSAPPQPGSPGYSDEYKGNVLGGVAEGIGEGVFSTAAGVNDIVDKVTGQQPGAVDKYLHTLAGDDNDSHGTAQNVGRGIEDVGEFLLGDEALKGLSLSEKFAKVGKVIKAAEDSPLLNRVLNIGIRAVRGGAVGGAQGLIKSGGDINAAESGGIAGAAGNAIIPELADGLGAGKKFLFGDSKDVFNPGLVNEIRYGNDLVQKPAEASIRSAVADAAEKSGTINIPEVDADINGGTYRGNPLLDSKELVGNGTTILDSHLDALKDMEKAAYDKVDKTVGFDLKAEKAQLANDTYKLKQLGNTDADITQRGNLIEAINDSTDRIAQAEKKLANVGLDPKAADALHQQRMAGQDIRKMLISTIADNNEINLDKLIEKAKMLQFTKNGNRLEQFFGSPEKAQEFMVSLRHTQDLGISAVKAQNMAKWIASQAAKGAGAFGVYEGLKKIL